MPFDQNGKWIPPNGGWGHTMDWLQQQAQGQPVQGPPTPGVDPSVWQSMTQQPNYDWSPMLGQFSNPLGPPAPQQTQQNNNLNDLLAQIQNGSVPTGSIQAPSESQKLGMDLGDIWDSIKTGFQDAGTQFGQGAANALGINDLMASVFGHADQQSGVNPQSDQWTNPNGAPYNQQAQTMAGTIAGGVGSMAPFILGGPLTDAIAGAASKAIPALGDSFLGNAASNIIGQTALGALQGGAKNALDQASQDNGFNLGQLGQSTAQGALGGAEFGAAGSLVGEPLKMLADATLPGAEGAVTGLLRDAGIAAIGGAGTGAAGSMLNLVSQYAQNPQAFQLNGQDMLDQGLTFALTDAAMSMLHGKLPGQNAFGEQGETAGTAGEQTPAPSGFKNAVAADQFQNTNASFMTGTRDMSAEGYQEVKPGIWQKPDAPGNYTYEMVPYDDNWLVPKYEVARNERQAQNDVSPAATQKSQSLYGRVMQYFQDMFTPKQAPATPQPQDQTGIVRQLTGDVQHPANVADTNRRVNDQVQTPTVDHVPGPVAEAAQVQADNTRLIQNNGSAVESVGNVDKPVENALDPQLVDAAKQFVANGGSDAPSSLQRQFKVGFGDATRLQDAIRNVGSENPVEQPKTEAPAENFHTDTNNIQLGDQVTMKGSTTKYEVTKNSDRSTITAKNTGGAELTVGRKAIEKVYPKGEAPSADKLASTNKINVSKILDALSDDQKDELANKLGVPVEGLKDHFNDLIDSRRAQRKEDFHGGMQQIADMLGFKLPEPKSKEERDAWMADRKAKREAANMEYDHDPEEQDAFAEHLLNEIEKSKEKPAEGKILKGKEPTYGSGYERELDYLSDSRNSKRAFGKEMSREEVAKWGDDLYRQGYNDNAPGIYDKRVPKQETPEMSHAANRMYGAGRGDRFDKEFKDAMMPMTDDQVKDYAVDERVKDGNRKKWADMIRNGKEKEAFKAFKEDLSNGSQTSSNFSVDGMAYKNGKQVKGLLVNDKVHGKEHVISWEDAFERFKKMVKEDRHPSDDFRAKQFGERKQTEPKEPESNIAMRKNLLDAGLNENQIGKILHSVNYSLNRNDGTLDKVTVKTDENGDVSGYVWKNFKNGHKDITRILPSGGMGPAHENEENLADHKTILDFGKTIEPAGKEEAPKMSQATEEKPTIDYKRTGLSTKQQNAIDNLLKEDRDWTAIYHAPKMFGWVEMRYETDPKHGIWEAVTVQPDGKVLDHGVDLQPSDMKTLWKRPEDSVSFAGMGLTVKERTEARRAADLQKKLGKKDIDPEAIVKHVKEDFAKRNEEHDKELRASGAAYEKFFFSVNPNMDEINAIKEKKPDAILLTYANWRPDSKYNKKIAKQFPTIKALTDYLGYKPEITLDSGGFSFTNPDSKQKTPTGVIDMFEEAQERGISGGQLALELLHDEYHMDDYDDPDEAEMDPAYGTMFREFLNYYNENKASIDHVMAFDDMTDPELSKFAYEFMDGLGINKTVPVWNINADPSILDEYVNDHKADAVAVGGYVPFKSANKTAEFVAKAKPILEKYPDVKFHILGLSDERIIKQLGMIHSSDSTYWASGAKFKKNNDDRGRQERMEDNIDKKQAMVDRLKSKDERIAETKSELDELNSQIADYEKGIAGSLGEANDAGLDLVKEIKDRGGIKPSDRFQAEYKKIPLHLKNKNGMPLDEIASELHMDASDLIDKIGNLGKKKTSDAVQKALQDDPVYQSLMETKNALEKGLEETQQEPDSMPAIAKDSWYEKAADENYGKRKGNDGETEYFIPKDLQKYLPEAKPSVPGAPPNYNIYHNDRFSPEYWEDAKKGDLVASDPALWKNDANPVSEFTGKLNDNNRPIVKTADGNEESTHKFRLQKVPIVLPESAKGMTRLAIKQAVVDHLFDVLNKEHHLKDVVDRLLEVGKRPIALQYFKQATGAGYMATGGDLLIHSDLATMEFKVLGYKGEKSMFESTMNDLLKIYEGKYKPTEADKEIPKDHEFGTIPHIKPEKSEKYLTLIEHQLKPAGATDVSVVAYGKKNRLGEYTDVYVHFKNPDGTDGYAVMIPTGTSLAVTYAPEDHPVEVLWSEPGAKLPDIPKAPEPQTETPTPITAEDASEKAPAKTKPLPEDPSQVTPEAMKTYSEAMRGLIGKMVKGIEDGTLPDKQAGFRKMASDHFGRVATDDEWSDALEAAVQQYADNKITPEMSLGDRIKIGQEAEKYLKNGGRSLEKSDRQQFSTPVPIAQAVHFAADVRSGETIKEGSAGTGSLLTPFLGDDVNLKAVELSPRRAAILMAQGYDVTNADTFKTNIKSDVVVGNPPFRGQNMSHKDKVSFTGNPPWKGSWGDLGNRFLNWDLKSLPDGGRLVHVTSPGVIDNQQNSQFRQWLKENHTVRAMIKLPADVYDTRGTKFGAGLIVVDKGKVEGAPEPIVGEAATWDEAIEMIKSLGGGGTHARVVEPNATRVRESAVDNRLGAESAAVRGGERGQQSADEGTPKGTSERGRGSDVSAGEGAAVDRSAGKSGSGVDAGRDESNAGRVPDVQSDKRNSDVVDEGQGSTRSPLSPKSESEIRDTSTSVSTDKERASSGSSDPNVSNFMGYVPGRKLTGRAHRGHVTESQNLTFVELPKSMYDDQYIPHEIVVNGGPNATKKLSDVQLETVMAAKYNAAQGRGILIADDTGMGKTAEQLGIAADAWHNKTAHRILVVTVKDQVARDSFLKEGNEDFDLNLPMTFMNSETHPNSRDVLLGNPEKEDQWKPIDKGDGVLVVSQYSMRDMSKAIHDWMDGGKKTMVVVDESHTFKNVDGSKTAEAMKELYERYKDSGVFHYASATAAEDIDGLEHLYGLGLWGPNTFGDFRMRLQGFEPSTGSGGRQAKGKNAKLSKGLQNSQKTAFQREIPLAMMEQIVREMKSEGQYMGRALSMEGVEMVPMPIGLSSEDKGDWNRAVQFVNLIAQKAEEHGNKPTDRGKIMSHVVGYMRRLRSYYVMKGIIEQIKSYQADPNSPVARHVLSGFFKGGDEGQNAHLEAAINAINDEAKTEDQSGETISVTIPEAVYDKEELRSILKGESEEWGEKPLPDLPSPIDMLNQAFGEDKVLVISGDIKPKDRSAVVAAWQKGERPVLYFTQAANTGISLHDTIGKRIGYYPVDYPWNANEQKQSEGRVHRTGQTTAPIFHYPYTDSSVDTKFVGTLLARYEAMGALSRGESAKLGGEALGNFDFTGPIAEEAVYNLIPRLDPDDRAAMFGDYTRDLFPEEDSGTTYNATAVREAMGGKQVDVKRFLNSLMYLDFDRGNEVFNQFTDTVSDVREKIANEMGMTDKFNTYHGEQTDATDGKDGITFRKIKTVLTDDQKKQFEYKINTLTDKVLKSMGKYGDVIDAEIEKAQERLDKLKAEADELKEKWQNSSGGKEAQDFYQRLQDKQFAVKNQEAKLNGLKKRDPHELAENGKIKSAKAALDHHSTRLQALKDEYEMNDNVMLLDGKFATNGKMVTIRTAIAKAAKAVYGEKVPDSALKVELRGYYLDNGERVVGAIIPPFAEREVMASLGARYEANNKSPEDIFKDLQSGSEIELEGGMTLKYQPVNKRVVVGGFTPRTDSKHRAIYEQIAKKGGIGFDRGNVVVTSPDGIKNIIERFPIKGQSGGKKAANDDYDHLASDGGKKSQSQQAKDETASTATAEPVAEAPEQEEPENPLNRPLAEAYLTPKATKQISDILAKHMESVIYHTGRMASSGAEGEYSNLRKAGSVKAKHSFNWRVVGHELGHAFQHMYDHVKGVSDEMKKVVDWFHTNPDAVAVKNIPSEGFSEFFRIYAVDPDAAEQVAPKTKAIMNRAVESSPELQDIFSKIRTIVANDLSGTPAERMVNSQSFMRGSWDDDPHGDMYEMPWYDRVAAKLIDGVIPMRRMDAAAKANGYEGIEVEKLAMLAGGSQAKALESYRSVPRHTNGQFVEGVVQRTLQDLDQEAIDKINKAIGYKKVKTNETVTSKNGKVKVKTKKYGAYELYSAMSEALRAQEIYEAEPKAVLHVSKENVADFLAQAETEWPEALEVAKTAAQQFSKITMDLMERNGLMTAEMRKATEKKYPNAYYMPFIEDGGKKSMLPGRAQRTHGSPFQRRKDNTNPVVDVYNARMMKLAQIHAAIEYKRVIDGFIDVAQKTPEMGKYLRQIRIPAHRLGIPVDQIEEWINNQFLDDPVSLDEIGDQVMNIFQPGSLRDVKGNETIVMSMRNGKPVFVELAPDLFEAFQSLKPLNPNGVVKMLSKIGGGTRYLSLLNPKYMANALFRDLPVQMIQSGMPVHKLMLNWHESVAAAMGLKPEVVSDFVQSGGYGGSIGDVLKNMTRTHLVDPMIYTNRPGLMRYGQKFLSFAVKSPRHALRIIEEYPRYNEYITNWKQQVSKLGYDAGEMWKLYQKGQWDQLPEPLQNQMEKILANAAYASKENIIPFQRRGSSSFLRSYVPTVPFLRGATVGTYTAVRNVKNRPLRSAIGMAMIAAMSALSWYYMNQNDDTKRFLRDLPSEMRDKYWFLPSGIPGVFVHIDKPFTYAFPANMLERFFDQTFGEHGSRTWNDDMLHNIAYEFGLDHPTASYLETALSIFANDDLNFGSPIVSKSLQSKLPSEQYDAHTSALAIGLSQWIANQFGPSAGWSPKYTDYFIQQMFGAAGKATLDGIDALMGDAHPDTSVPGLEYGSVTGAFLTGQAQGGSRVEDKFYNDVSKFTALSSTLSQYVQKGKTGVPAGVTMNDAKGVYFLPTMQAYQKGLSDVRNFYNSKIAQTPDPQMRRTLTMQMNYYEKALAGMPYGVQPEPPNPDAQLTQEQIDSTLNFYMQAAQKKQTDAINKEASKVNKGDMKSLGPIYYAQYLMSQLQNGQK